MAWIAPSKDSRARWVTVTAKIPRDLSERLIQFREEAGLHNKSDAIRFLIAAGLDSHWGSQTNVIGAIQANAKARALERFTVLMNQALDGLMTTFNDPAFDIDAEEP